MRNLLCLLAVVATATANPLLGGGLGGDSDGKKPGAGSFPFVVSGIIYKPCDVHNHSINDDDYNQCATNGKMIRFSLYRPRKHTLKQSPQTHSATLRTRSSLAPRQRSARERGQLTPQILWDLVSFYMEYPNMFSDNLN